MVELTHEQLTEIRETFALFDREGTGTITLEDMGILVRALGQTPSEAELQNMKREADPSGSGKVDCDTLIEVYSRYYKDPITEQEILGAFQELDEHNKGVISLKRLKHLLSTCGELLTEEEIQRIISLAKPDTEGNINYSEFVKVMVSNQ